MAVPAAAVRKLLNDTAVAGGDDQDGEGHRPGEGDGKVGVRL